MSTVKVRKNLFGFYIIQSSAVKNHAWSGSRWVPIDKDGLPAGIGQVCNFAGRKEAKEHARKAGLTVEADDPLDVGE